MAAGMYPVRGIYFATHFNNWYEEASDGEVVQYLGELAEWGLNQVSVWFDMHDYAGIDDPAAGRRLKRLKLIFRTARRLGLDRDLTFLSNESFKDSPPELRADWLPGKNGYTACLRGHYHVELCPSKLGAMDLLLKWRRQVFEAFMDEPPTSVTPFPYDQGGCTCADCAPWGSNGHVRVSRRIADLAREMFPGVKVSLATWRFDVFGDLHEWDGLFAQGDELRGWCDSLFIDPRDSGRVKGGAPGGLPFIAMNEISMNRMLPWGGYGANPSPARLQGEFDRNPNAAGLRPYSEGIYEDMNKVMALGMLRDPSKTALDMVGDYAARYFGEPTREPVKEAVALLEENMWREAAGVQVSGCRCQGSGDDIAPANCQTVKPSNCQTVSESSHSPYSLKGIDPSGPWSVVHNCRSLDGARARRALGLLDAAERTMDANRRASWRWRLLRIRAELDCALARGTADGEMEPLFDELARMYHVTSETRSYVVPPSKALWLKVVDTWQDLGI